MNGRSISLFLLLLGLLASGAQCPREGVREVDLSGFGTFEFAQTPALGFCPELDAVYEATITRQEDGSHLLEMSTIEEGQAGVDECEEDLFLFDTDCAVVHELPDRTLADAEVQRVAEVFQAVRIRTLLLEPMCVDPCMLNVYRWDDLSVTDGVAGCGPGLVELLDASEQQEIGQLLEELRGTDRGLDRTQNKTSETIAVPG